MSRKPNILVTGTPGTGKTTLSGRIAELLNMKHIELSEYVKENNLYESYDDEYQSYVIDEDKILDDLEEKLWGEGKGNVIVDYHASDFFPERWFDLVVVLRVDNTILYDRLSQRNYPQKKLTENVECEIMGILEDEARDSYDESIIWSFSNNLVEEMEEIVEKVKTWYENRCCNSA